jgi:hypothetical protein
LSALLSSDGGSDDEWTSITAYFAPSAPTYTKTHNEGGRQTNDRSVRNSTSLRPGHALGGNSFGRFLLLPGRAPSPVSVVRVAADVRHSPRRYELTGADVTVRPHAVQSPIRPAARTARPARLFVLVRSCPAPMANRQPFQPRRSPHSNAIPAITSKSPIRKILSLTFIVRSKGDNTTFCVSFSIESAYCFSVYARRFCVQGQQFNATTLDCESDEPLTDDDDPFAAPLNQAPCLFLRIAPSHLLAIANASFQPIYAERAFL